MISGIEGSGMRGESQAMVGPVCCNLIQPQPLLRCADATGNPRTDHKAMIRLEFLAASLVTLITVILLVYTMKLDQLGIVFCYCAARIIQ